MKCPPIAEYRSSLCVKSFPDIKHILAFNLSPTDHKLESRPWSNKASFNPMPPPISQSRACITSSIDDRFHQLYFHWSLIHGYLPCVYVTLLILLHILYTQFNPLIPSIFSFSCFIKSVFSHIFSLYSL